MFGNAKWIACDGSGSKSKLFRKEFSVSRKVKSAQISYCALGYGVVTINGKPVTQEVLTTALTTFDRKVMYNTYDVTELLNEGANAVGVMLGNGWYNDVATTWDYEKAPWRSQTKFILKLIVKYEDSGEEELLSDSSWKNADSPCIYNHVRAGEAWDARLEIPGWDEPGFCDGEWGKSYVCRAPGGVIKPMEHPPIRMMRTLPSKEIFPGIYDIGENISGWARITVKGNPGDTVDLYYSERVTPDGDIDTKNINEFNLDEYAHQDRYILKGEGTEVWEPHFCYHGFRYVKAVTNVSEFSLEGVIVHTDLPIVGEFECSDEMLNKIHMATRHSTLYNFHGIPTDCPQREQNGWTGDASLSAEQALMNYDMSAAYFKWLGDICDVQRPSGQIPCIVPTGGWGYNGGCGPAWDSAFILIPYYMWKYTGDVAPLKAYWENMKRYMEFFESMLDNGLADFGLGDWCPPANANICPTVITDTAYHYAESLVMAEMAEFMGECGDIYRERAKNTREAFRAAFIKDGKIIPESQTAYACAIYQGLLTEEEVPVAAARLNELVAENGYHIDCGILGTKYIFRALTDNGYAETLYKMVTNPTCPSYAYWMNQGMTTLCEAWEMTSSLNHHMFSEVELWFYRYLAGIRLDGEKLVIAPVFLKELSWVKAKSRGVEVSWDSESVEVTVPADATLILDGKEIELKPGTVKIQRK